MIKQLAILTTFLMVFTAFANVDPTCYTQTQEIGLDMRILGFEGKYVGISQTNKAVFYNEALETLYIFEDGLNSPPLEIPWTQATDLRWKDNEQKSFVQYKNEGIKSYISSLGIRCGAAGATVDPKNSAVIFTAKASTCSDIGQPFSAVGGKCCEGLTYNPNTKTCDEPAYKDPDLKTCTSDSQCSVGMGCLPQKANLMFSKKSDNDDVIELNDFMRELLDEQLDESEFLEVGKSCTHSSQCGSYNCDAGVCKEAKVCRYGEEGETVNAGTKCNEDKHLVKSGGGVCELSPESKNSLFLGLYEENTDLFTENQEAGKCQFEMSPGVKERTTQALKSIRAMEWLFASISRSDSDDCFQVNRKLRDEIGKPFMETRKYLLQDFSAYYASIKKDYEVVKAALMSSQDAKVESQKEVEIHGAVNQEGHEEDRQIVTEHVLATRQSSGYDTLMFMYRRNLLFQSYEKGMLTNIDNIYDQISNLNKEMPKWSDGATSWNLGDRMVGAYHCKAKYKKLTWKGWKTKYYNNVANRWTDYYEVTGKQELNLNPATDAQVIQQLKLIGNIENDEDITRIFNRKHYLIDPLMPGKTESQGGLAFTRFGTKKSLRSGGLFGFLKKRDLRDPRYLKGGSVLHSYTGIREDFKARIIQYYKELKLNEQQTGFVFEPELISTDAIDCIDKMDKEPQEGDKCQEFNQYIDDLTDYGIAHFLAYSYHTNSKYSGYFTNAQTWRRRLFSRLEVDLLNLQRYYHEIINIRQKQTECLESLINHVSDKYLSGGNTVSQGSVNYYDGGKYTGNNAGTAKVNGKIGTLSEASRQKYSFSANTSAWKGIADSLINDSRGDLSSSNNVAGDTSISSGSVSGSSAAFNRRRERMEESNKKLSESGVNVDEKNSKFLSTLGVSGSSSYGSSQNQAGSGIKTYSSGSGFDLNYNGNMSGDLKVDDNALASIAPNAGALSGSDNGLSSRGGPSSVSLREGDGGASGGSSDASAGNGYQDPTGMTDDEKSVLMANLERTKGRYKPDEADTLFDVVSKAYIRNLDKVLTRRKKID